MASEHEQGPDDQEHDGRGSILFGLFPFLCLVWPKRQADPVIGIGLPREEPVKDATMISAYYLSFYE